MVKYFSLNLVIVKDIKHAKMKSQKKYQFEISLLCKNLE